MEKVINLSLPHVSEQIFEECETEDLIQFLEVSETWKILAENVLLRRYSGKMLEAVLTRSTKLVQLLLDQSNCDERTHHFKDAYLWACKNEVGQDIAQLLIDHTENKIDLKAKDENGWTRFMKACGRGEKHVVQLLLDHPSGNIDYNAKTKRLERTGFSLACCYGQKDVVQMLLDYAKTRKIDLNAKDDNGWTGFTEACYNGHKDIVQLLLDHPSARDIDFNATSLTGKTAYMFARIRGKSEVVKLLQKYSDVIRIN